MNILLVDDKRELLQELEAAVSEAMPTAQCFSFQDSQEALDFAETTPIDIAFWDVHMHYMRLYMGDISLALALSNICPDCKIIFCIDSDEFLKVVPRVKNAPHLLKPITAEKVRDGLKQVGYSLSE